jgi:hypothetical protein
MPVWDSSGESRFMAERETDSKHSHELPPMADRDGGSLPGAPIVELRERKSGTSSGMRRRVALLIGLSVACQVVRFL